MKPAGVPSVAVLRVPPWAVQYGVVLWALVLLCHTVQGVQQITNPRIIEHPEDQYVAKNEPATLNCKAEGDPPPLITWYRDGKPVITADENPQSHRMLLPSGQLFFLRIIHNKSYKPDVGTYYCNATNPETRVSVVSRNATIEIAVLREDFQEHPRNAEVAVGDIGQLQCNPPRGLPPPDVKWKKDGEAVRIGGRFKLESPGDLVIADARHTDSGIYVCVAHNKAGERESSPARMLVRERPRITKAPQDVTEEEGRNVQLTCQAEGDPLPTIVWQREDGQVPPARSEILADRSLKISKVQVSDEGTYVCRAENSVGSVEAVARLTVHSEPTFLVTPRDKVVGVSRRVSFRCEVIGNPPPALFWSKETNQVLMFPRQDVGRFSVTEDGTLVIDSVRPEDGGEYMCQAISVAGSAFAKASLQVKDMDPRPPPIIHQGPQNQTLPVNSVAMLQCSASGDPPPAVRWYKDRHVITLRDPRFALLDSGTLQISDLRRADTGMYTCKAMSETGETSWGAALIVEAPTNPAVIFHRTPEPSTFPGPPSPPAIADVADTAMMLSWKANPNHGASPVFAYTVEYFSHETGEGWVIADDSVTEQSHLVRGLLPDTPYMFLVRAQNSHGLSQPSTVTAPVRTTGTKRRQRPSLPGGGVDLALVTEKLQGQVVYMLQPKVISSTAVQLNWEIRKSGRYIEGYHIRYRVFQAAGEGGPRESASSGGFTTETVTTGSATTYMLRHLHKYTWYEVRIQPFYRTVEGQESNTVRVLTIEDRPDAPPLNIKAPLLDNTTLHLSWSPPRAQARNGPLKGYRIYLYGNESRYNREIAVNDTVTKLIVNHLVPGMTYRIQILAFTRVGDGPPSDPVLVGGDGAHNGRLNNSYFREPWFIATLIGTIGCTVWFALCVFSIWLYRKKHAKKKLAKGAGPNDLGNQKMDDGRRLDPMFSNLNAPNYLQKDLASHVEALAPDVTHVGPDSKLDPPESVYNQPHCGPVGGLHTFYNNKPQVVAQPYATTTLITAGGPGSQDSAFRPITQPGYVTQAHSSSDSCQKPPLGEEDEPPECLACQHGGCECQTFTADEDGYDQIPAGGLQPMLFLPPPPEHPPPSDIGTPPDSPTGPRRHHHHHHHHHHHMGPGGGHYSDHSLGQGYYHVAPQRGAGAGSDGIYSRANPYSDSSGTTSGPRGAPRHRPPSPKFRTMSPGHKAGGPRGGPGVMMAGGRAYSPHTGAISEPEGARGPTPPVRGYKLVPISSGAGPHYSDTEPGGPMRLHTPPSPAPPDTGLRGLDPVMDRAIQSSLPSLQCHQYPGGPGAESDLEVLGRQLAGPEGWTEEEEDSSGLEEVAVGPEELEPEEPATSTDDDDDDDDLGADHHAYLPETDFASAVAKAAELSGLTVVGSTVMDPGAGQPPPQPPGHREKVKKPAKHRQRAKRPTSPYSTDSNYSSIQVPHRPYPKSARRKKQSGAQHHRAPPHSQALDLPSYSRPTFPSSSGATKSPGGGEPGDLPGEQSFRTNPLAAFDTRDTPIV